MRAAALELAAYGITVNAVVPGNINTEGMRTMGEAFTRKLESHTPLQCLSESEDIARAILFLASDEARYITGQSLVVDGGYSINEPVVFLGRF